VHTALLANYADFRKAVLEGTERALGSGAADSREPPEATGGVKTVGHTDG